MAKLEKPTRNDKSFGANRSSLTNFFGVVMKKNTLCALCVLIFGASCFSQVAASSQELLVQFVKGNITQKTAAVKRSGEDSSIAKNALDFVVQNATLLEGDRDLAALAVAGILSYPAAEYSSSPQNVTELFKSVFYGIDDATVRISVFDKLALFYVSKPFEETVNFVNEYLLQKIASGEPLDDTVKKSVEVLEKMGNGSSFAGLYSILQTRIWQDIHPAVTETLVAIADKSLNSIIDAINSADLTELKLLFQVYEKNNKISSTLRSEIANQMLNSAIIISGNSSLSRDLAEFQLDCAKILAENQWTRAAELGRNYFNVAKVAYEVNFLSGAQFAEAIHCVEVLASRTAVRPLAEYMDQLNKAQESGNIPDKTVVLAIINALGALGDKSAFDCLLYVTYLDYPENVTTAARNALTRLKW